MNATANGHATRLCDPTAAAGALRLIVGDGVTELRALDATTRSDGWPATQSGYFDDVDKLAAALAGLTAAKGVYFTPNPVEPALLARAANRIRKTPKGESTQDTNIIARKWLLVDCDPQRPAGISSTGAEHDASLGRAQAVDLFLHDEGWPDPIYADSGNGAHLLYRVDLPADDGGIVQRCLTALAARFDDDGVKIDRTVYNPARIWKLYGTLACKGDDTPERPHRMSRIINAPETPQAVPRELLDRLAAEATEGSPNRGQHNGQYNGGNAPFDVAGFIARNNLDVAGPFDWNGGRKWTFNVSPMCEHGDDGPHIEQHANGAISAGCHHNSCAWSWADLRARFEPKRERMFDGGDRWTEQPPRQEQANRESSKVEFKRITSQELASGSFEIDFAIDETMVREAALIFAGPQKVLKTSIIIDAGISLATGGYFLGRLRVARPCRVAIMTGESGLSVIQETANRICHAAGQRLGSLDNLIWSTDLPKFGAAAHLDALEKFLLADGIEVLAIDPAYLTMPGADAGNLMIQGELLRGVNDICQRCKTTLVLAHHTNRGAGRDNLEPLQLCDIAWAGYSEFAAQGWLLNRREKYTPGTGEHRLWLTVGGRAGHSALWALDIDEGLRTDEGGRRWQVNLQGASEARDGAEQRRADAKAQRQAEQLGADVRKLIDALAAMPDEEGTKTDLKDRTGLYQSRFAAALASALASKDIIPKRITKANGQTYDGYKLNHPDTPG
jgi:hypothetical protein